MITDGCILVAATGTQAVCLVVPLPQIYSSQNPKSTFGDPCNNHTQASFSNSGSGSDRTGTKKAHLS
jgi:hypothetical protein